jgi:hypothetical protein
MKKIVAILALALCVACVKQDLPEGWDGRGCPVSFGLHLEYRIDIDGDNVLRDEIGDIQIYIFDSETGVLYKIIRLTSEQIVTGRIPADLPPGKYDFIAWGSGSGRNDMAAGGYNDLHMRDPLAQIFDLGVKVGVTRIDDFRMRLGVGDPNANGHSTPQVADFDDLFYADNRGFVVTGTEDQTVPLTFVRNSHMLQVRVYGVQYIEATTRADQDSPLQIYVTGRNGSYHHNNTIDQRSNIVHYEPGVRHLADEDQVHSDIKVLHLDKEYHTGDNKMELVVRDRINDKDVARIDVLDYISRLTDGGGAQRYPTQEHISREKEFLIPLYFEPDTVNGGLRITVNDWVIGYYRPTEIIPWIPVD